MFELKSVFTGWLRHLFKHQVNVGFNWQSKTAPHLHVHNCISNSANLGLCFLAKCFVRMHSSEENGIAKEAIVVEWLVSSASRNFEVVKKWWAGALLGVKCCCFVQKLSWKCHAILNQPNWRRRRKKEGRKYTLMAQYFRDALLRH